MDAEQSKKKYKEFADYLLSKVYTQENLKKMEHSIMMRNNFQELHSRGGLCLPRGYYCPSLLMELLITNVSRGRLLKKTKKTPDYTYYFDEGELKLVGKEDADTGKTDFEWIEKNGNIEYSIFKDAANRITISEYEKDRIVKNRFLTVFSKSQYELIIEDYNYNKENKLISAMYKSVSVSWNDFYEEEYRFDFLYDEEGTLLNCLINKESETRIPSAVKALITGKKEAEKKKKLRESEVGEALQTMIKDWKGEDIYAISVFINHESDEVTDFAVSCNHEEQQQGEERWNYTFWEQAEESLMNLLDDRETDYMNLLDITSSAVVKLRDKDFFRKNFGKDIAVIIHGYEYEETELEATRKANPNGEADEFFSYLNCL